MLVMRTPYSTVLIFPIHIVYYKDIRDILPVAPLVHFANLFSQSTKVHDVIMIAQNYQAVISCCHKTIKGAKILYNPIGHYSIVRVVV